MATTSLWRVTGRLDHLIDYVENPEKTSPSDLNKVLSYATAQQKTTRKAGESEPLLRQYVTGVNCSAATALSDMHRIKKRFNKLDGTLAYHGYQSFAPGETTPEIAHEIGVKLARQLWGDKYQVIVATHLDKESHLHSHFVINTVSFKDGIKFHRSSEDYRRMREASDALCREYGLSVITSRESKTKSYAEWEAEKNGQPTIRSMIRADIDRAIQASSTERMFYKTLREMGYDIQFLSESGAELKYPKLKPPGAKGWFRFHKLGEGYTPEEITYRVLQNYYRNLPFPEAEIKVGSEERRQAYKAITHKKARGLYALYLYYCYELHIIQRHPSSLKQVPFCMREDLLKMDRLDKQTQLLARTGIETDAQLQSYRANAQSQIEALTDQRRQLRNEFKRVQRQNDSAKATNITTQISDISARLKTLREEVKLCTEIEERTNRIRNALSQLRQENEIEEKETNENELLRRRSRAGREDDAERR